MKLLLRPLASVCLLTISSLAWSGPNPAAGSVLVLGDSLSAGYGLHADEGWVALLARRLIMEGYGRAVVNASVSGETTTGGLSRVAHVLATHHPAVVIVELGANDALRGLPTQRLQDNLLALVAAAHGSGAQVLLVGAPLPSNYGEEYAQQVASAYRSAARRGRVPLVASLLAGLAPDERSFQSDHLHPVAAAQGQMLENVWSTLRTLLGKPDRPTGVPDGR